MQMIAWQHKLTGHFRIMQEKNRDEVQRTSCTNKEKCNFVLSTSMLFFCSCTTRKWPIPQHGHCLSENDPRINTNVWYIWRRDDMRQDYRSCYALSWNAKPTIGGKKFLHKSPQWTPRRHWGGGW